MNKRALWAENRQRRKAPMLLKKNEQVCDCGKRRLKKRRRGGTEKEENITHQKLDMRGETERERYCGRERKR